MQIKLDFRSGIPIYVQIMDQIKNQLAAGALKPDDQLPTVRQLASDLRVNFNTVARAYRLLDEAGLISTQHGRGTYILPPPHQEAAELLKRQVIQGLTHNYLHQAQRLGMTPGEVRETLEPLLAQWELTEVFPDPEIE
jgi:GntR family transcriptional regulator